EYVEDGFTAIKMKIGLGSPKLDIARVEAVRKAIGDDIRLMVDANHCFTVPAAIRLGRELEALNVEWFEEPISPEDLDGYVEVTRALDMAVAGARTSTRGGASATSSRARPWISSSLMFAQPVALANAARLPPLQQHTGSSARRTPGVQSSV